jgi:serine/threonine protein kinase
LVSQAGGLRRLMQEAAAKYRDPAGLNIGGYEIGDELGKGGMGVVYRAVRKADGATLAIKVMLARVAVDESARQMFLREIEVAKLLRHPHVVSLLESGSAGGAFFFAMEFCNRGSLAQLTKRQRGKLSLGMAAPLMQQILAGLEYAHEQGYVHRDLKPHNILLDEQAGHWTAKISDFGLAKNFEKAGLSGMTATGSFAGTYHFMPREQLTQFKYVRPVSDVWSIAATFYHMLTGRFPLDFPRDRDPMEVILHDEPVAIRQREASLPASVAEVIDRGLATDTARRYQTAGEFRAALEQATGAAP